MVEFAVRSLQFAVCSCFLVRTHAENTGARVVLLYTAPVLTCAPVEYYKIILIIIPMINTEPTTYEYKHGGENKTRVRTSWHPPSCSTRRRSSEEQKKRTKIKNSLRSMTNDELTYFAGIVQCCCMHARSFVFPPIIELLL